MAAFRATDATALLEAVAHKSAAARLLAIYDPRGVQYPLLTARAALDGGHRCNSYCICLVVGR